jgi:protoporphyrin/coproporphyrin ferrochelatase
VETLHEIDIEARELAGKLGIRQFEVMPALNDSPTFIRALADLVTKAVMGEQTNSFQLNPQAGCAIVGPRSLTA